MSFNRFTKNRRKKEPLDVDITSLLDILVILLVFLLKSYDDSALKINLVENLSLPSSFSQDLGDQSIQVQVNYDQTVWVDNKEVGKIDLETPSTIPFLSKILKERKEEIEKKREIAGVDDKRFKKNLSKNVNLIFDRELPYKSMRKVMHTAAVSGFPSFKFIVQGVE